MGRQVASSPVVQLFCLPLRERTQTPRGENSDLNFLPANNVTLRSSQTHPGFPPLLTEDCPLSACDGENAAFRLLVTEEAPALRALERVEDRFVGFSS
jgi:hypothetical protein